MAIVSRGTVSRLRAAVFAAKAARDESFYYDPSGVGDGYELPPAQVRQAVRETGEALDKAQIAFDTERGL